MLVGAYGERFAHELLRVVSSSAGWTSTPLVLSTPGQLRELLVSASYARRGVLSDGSVDQLRARLLQQVKDDIGTGPQQFRGQLLRYIAARPEQLAPGTYAAKVLTQLSYELDRSYVGTWTSELARQEYVSAVDPETEGLVTPGRAALSLGTYLLDLGFSGTYLARWLDYRIKYSDKSLTVADLVADLEAIVAAGPREFEVVAAVTQTSNLAGLQIDGWITAKEARKWFAETGHEPPRTIHGGLVFHTRQYDIDAAEAHVRSALRRFQRLAHLATGGAPELAELLWIKGLPKARRHRSGSSDRLRVPAYEFSEIRAERPESTNRLEVAMDFLQSAVEEDDAAAAGMLWAALEALLYAPADGSKTSVVERAADLALVSFIRYSLTNSLGFVIGRCRGEPLREELRGLEGAALQRWEDALRADEHLALKPWSARLNAEYAKRALDPEHLNEVRADIVHVLFGLYRQRNLVLHGGVTDAPLLRGLLRASLPLVIAVVNRYASGLKQQPDPHLAAFGQGRLLEAYCADPTAYVSRFWGAPG